jgi:hypothetical protein
MRIWGTVNPSGEADEYQGYYLTKQELTKFVAENEMVGKPVKIEHTGPDVGKVVSAWVNSKGQLDCIIDINQRCFEGAMISSAIDEGLCRELSMGYVVEMQHSAEKKQAVPISKKVVEVSIVKKGARDRCFIHAAK